MGISDEKYRARRIIVRYLTQRQMQEITNSRMDDISGLRRKLVNEWDEPYKGPRFTKGNEAMSIAFNFVQRLIREAQ